MTGNPFVFSSVIYNGFDAPRDGIGNHLGLFDRLIFPEIDPSRKSLSPVPAGTAVDAYGKVASDLHLREPDRFKNALFLDVARETWDPARIRGQMARTVRHKRAFNAVTAIYLMWESDRLSDLYAEMVSHYDFCIVTSSLLDDYLADRGVDVVKLRHPYPFAGLERRPPGRAHAGRFRFGISAGLWSRKNVSLLAREFHAALGGEPTVELSIHTRSDVMHPDFREEYESLVELRRNGARIEIVNESLSREDYLDWLGSLDMYCFVSSGEGYSITPREALHLGIPVILHDAHVHREFSHLPGVVRVASSGVQRATPNTTAASLDIGMDWRVDRDALRQALSEGFHNHRTLTDALRRDHERVLELHDPISIKGEWVRTLNEKYRQYMDRVRLYYPGVRETPLNSSELTEIDLGHPGFQSATGYTVPGAVICLRSRHSPGHCLYGPYVPVARAGLFAVVLGIEILSDEPSGDILVLDIYDSAADTVLSERRIHHREINGTRGECGLEARMSPGQVIEFRVYWTGRCDLAVSSLRVDDRLQPLDS